MTDIAYQSRFRQAPAPPSPNLRVNLQALTRLSQLGAIFI